MPRSLYRSSADCPGAHSTCERPAGVATLSMMPSAFQTHWYSALEGSTMRMFSKLATRRQCCSSASFSRFTSPPAWQARVPTPKRHSTSAVARMSGSTDVGAGNTASQRAWCGRRQGTSISPAPHSSGVHSLRHTRPLLSTPVHAPPCRCLQAEIWQCSALQCSPVCQRPCRTSTYSDCCFQEHTSQSTMARS